MKFIVLERRQTPAASFYTYADVGAAQEVKGITGLAHLFEHMAFKGSPNIGTKDYEKERLAPNRVGRSFAALRAERQKGRQADPQRLKLLEDEFRRAQEEAGRHVVPNEFGDAIERAGGHGLNASTRSDATDYLQRYADNIRRVTRADVERVARERLRDDRLFVLVLGKSSSFDRPLSTLGPVTTVDVTIPPDNK